MRPITRRLVVCLTVAALCFAPATILAEESSSCANGKSRSAAMWYSIAHPGLGEWYLNDWGYFNDNAPQRKFWLGFIPFYGWPGYLQWKSATDARHCRTNDDI